MTAPRKIATGLHRIETKVSGTDMPLAIHLIEGDRWLVTDTGCVGMMQDLAIPAVDRLRPGGRIGRAVVSHAHADHFGGNAELLAAEPECRIFVHEDDAGWAREPAWHVRRAYDEALGADYPCPTDVQDWVAGLLGRPAPVTPLRAGEAVPLDDGRALRVVHLPGHSPGHIGLWEPEERLLLLSDAVLGDGQKVDGRVVGIPAYLDVDAYLGSIRTVRSLAPATCCPAHFAVMDAEATQTFCDAAEAFVLRLDAAIRTRLDEADGTTLRSLTAVVVRAVAPGVEPSMVAALSVQAHLDALADRGLARWDMHDDVRIWRST